MSVTHRVGKCSIKILGIKIFELASDYSWKEFDGDIEDIRDDIILHERISEIVNDEQNTNNQ